MKLIHAPSELPDGERKTCVAIGFFDGVHLGHQQIVRQTVADARQHEATALIITFDRHPNSVVAPDRVPPLIYSLPQKLRVLGSLGADLLWLIPFDQPFSQRSAEQFVRDLARDFNQLHSVCVGTNFQFGHKRAGNVELLRKLGAELNFSVHGMAAVSVAGRTVSSTRVRERLLAGDLDAVSQMLGRAYSLAGTVVPGDRLGQKLGFPTANLEVTGLALPPHGVYAVHAKLDHQRHRAVLNIGVRPTLNNPVPQLRVEAHLLDFSGNLYGQEIEIVFGDKLRDEKKFDSLDELQQQIGKDIDLARRSF